MARLNENHLKVDAATNVGKCSVPMWCGGLPAGFCDKPAHGIPVKCQMFRYGDGSLRRIDGKYDGYVPGLACTGHGGPKE